MCDPLSHDEKLLTDYDNSALTSLKALDNKTEQCIDFFSSRLATISDKPNYSRFLAKECLLSLKTDQILSGIAVVSQLLLAMAPHLTDIQMDFTMGSFLQKMNNCVEKLKVMKEMVDKKIISSQKVPMESLFHLLESSYSTFSSRINKFGEAHLAQLIDRLAGCLRCSHQETIEDMILEQLLPCQEQDSVHEFLTMFAKISRFDNEKLGKHTIAIGGTTSIVNNFQVEIEKAIQKLQVNLVDKEKEVKLMLLAALCQEHILLLGPPGSGKTSLCNMFTKFLSLKEPVVKHIVTQTTAVDDLFYSKSEDRSTAGYLPEVKFALLEDIFSASSSVIEHLLPLLKEHIFNNGVEQKKVPIQTVFATGREYPNRSDTQELYEQFLFRCWTDSSGFLKEDNFKKLITLKRSEIDLSPLAESNLKLIREKKDEVIFPDSILHFLFQLKEILDKDGTKISARRWLKISQVLKMSAFTNSRDSVDLLDCSIVHHIVCSNHSDKEEFWTKYLNLLEKSMKVGDPLDFANIWISKEERRSIQDVFEKVAPQHIFTDARDILDRLTLRAQWHEWTCTISPLNSFKCTNRYRITLNMRLRPIFPAPNEDNTVRVFGVKNDPSKAFYVALHKRGSPACLEKALQIIEKKYESNETIWLSNATNDDVLPIPHFVDLIVNYSKTPYYNNTTPITEGLRCCLDATVARPVIKDTVWPDITANKFDATASNTAKMPVLIETSNGDCDFDALRFDGIDDGLAIADQLVLNKNYTIFIVNRYYGDIKGRALQSRSNNWLLGLWKGNVGHFAEGWVHYSAAETNKWYICSCSRTANGFPFWLNSVELGTASGGKASPLKLGLVGGGFHQEQSQADIAEVLVYDRELTSHERKCVEQYLSNKYGIALT